MSSNLELFYQQALTSLRKIAEENGVYLSEGFATADNDALYWRLSAHLIDPSEYWAGLWLKHSASLGLCQSIRPGDNVVDQEGRVWTLVGLDPGSERYPVRLRDRSGTEMMAPIEAAALFQHFGDTKSEE